MSSSDLINRPAYDRQHEGHCGQHVAHGAGEGRGGELESSVVEVLVDDRPADMARKLVRQHLSNQKSACHSAGDEPEESEHEDLHEDEEGHLGAHLPVGGQRSEVRR